MGHARMLGAEGGPRAARLPPIGKAVGGCGILNLGQIDLRGMVGHLLPFVHWVCRGRVHDTTRRGAPTHRNELLHTRTDGVWPTPGLNLNSRRAAAGRPKMA